MRRPGLRAPGGRGARTSGRRRSVARGDADSRHGSTPGAEGARGWGKGIPNRGSAVLRPGISCPRRATGDAAGCVTARATSGSRVVNRENLGFHEAGEEHWSDATLEGRAGEWKGAELEFPLKLGLRCKRKLGGRKEGGKEDNVTSFLHLAIKKCCFPPPLVGKDHSPAGASSKLDMNFNLYPQPYSTEVTPPSNARTLLCLLCFLLPGSSFICVGPGSEDSHPKTEL